MSLLPPILLSGIPAPSSPFGNAAAQGPDAEVRERYALLACAYAKAFEALGAHVTILDAPGIYHSAEAQATMGIDAKAIHLAVRPVADIRPFHGHANYAVFDGPIAALDEASGATLRSPIEILSGLAGVLCTSERLAEQLRGRGIAGATVLPPVDLGEGRAGLKAFADAVGQS